jgi:hypothetical protein
MKEKENLKRTNDEERKVIATIKKKDEKEKEIKRINNKKKNLE